MRPAAAWLPVVALLLCACAAGRDGAVDDQGPGADVEALDGQWEPYLWPDSGSGADGPVDAAGDAPGDAWADPDLPVPPDFGAPDQPPPLPCPDLYEANENCSAAKDLGSVNEGTSWISKTATLNPVGDIDWYRAKGLESSHTCFPLTKQTYYFKVRVTVPAGRKMKLCVYQSSCTGSATCQDNTSSGATQLDVQYKVSGTCALNDDTEARILVQPLDGLFDCTAYAVSFNYDN